MRRPNSDLLMAQYMLEPTSVEKSPQNQRVPFAHGKQDSKMKDPLAWIRERLNPQYFSGSSFPLSGLFHRHTKTSCNHTGDRDPFSSAGQYLMSPNHSLSWTSRKFPRPRSRNRHDYFHLPRPRPHRITLAESHLLCRVEAGYNKTTIYMV